jgi:RNA polymerase sigma-70 factor, ECF subfamily
MYPCWNESAKPGISLIEVIQLTSVGYLAMKSEPSKAKYERFVVELLPRLNSIAQNLAYPNLELAKDMVQETIIKGYQAYNSGKLDLSSKTLAWMTTVIRNEFLMARRKDKRIIEQGEDTESYFPAHDGDRDFENANLRKVLQEALLDLPEDQRDCVVLVDLQRFDYEEAAEILGVPVGTVRSRLSRARLKLAGRLSFLVQPS